MKTTIKFIAVLVSVAMLGQALAMKKPSLKEYRKTKNHLETAYSTFDMHRRLQLYREAEQVTRTAWGGLQSTIIDKRIVELGDGRYEMALHDYDKDRRPDQFSLSTAEGKVLPQDFGYLYDLNQDQRVDYIVYFGGSMITKDGDIHYYFYHWLDSDHDGQIDAIANAIFIHPDEARPDPERVFWVMDVDKDGKPDRVDYIEGETGENFHLPAENGIWHYNTLFGPKEVDAGKSDYFVPYTEFMKAVNGNQGN